MTRVALLSQRKEIVQDTPNFDKQQFLYYLSRQQYEHEWGTKYRRPGVGTRILAFFLKILPRVGPLSAVKFKIPTQQTEDMYIKSMDLTVENYENLLKQINHGSPDLTGRDLDTGRDTQAGEYQLADKTYAKLVNDVSTKSATPIPPSLQKSILSFYSDPKVPPLTQKKKKDWEKLQHQLRKLQAMVPQTPANLGSQ